MEKSTQRDSVFQEGILLPEELIGKSKFGKFLMVRLVLLHLHIAYWI